MVCAHLRSIILSLKLGDYLSVQAYKPCSISHLYFSGKLYKVCLLGKVCASQTIMSQPQKWVGLSVKYSSLNVYCQKINGFIHVSIAIEK